VDVNGKTILVTGAGRGIGRALALHFAGKGAQLALLDSNAEDLEESRRRCAEAGVAARSYRAESTNVRTLFLYLGDFVGWLCVLGTIALLVRARVSRPA